MGYDLSVLIPSRNEDFLKPTVDGLLAARRARTEVVVVCDGRWPMEPLDAHPDVTLVKVPEPLGQRGATNLAAQLATGRYVMKLDAHCLLAEGFDAELVATGDALGPEVTQVPRMYNLHAFDWVCPACGAHRYQGPAGPCEACGHADLELQLVWKPRLNRRSDFMRFDTELHFQYWGQYGRRPEAEPEVADLMCCLGACWVLDRRRYWELGGLDEGHGSWGQMGVEVACKAWLSGGRLVVNKRTWFSHLFRTQPGFGMPYPLSGREVEAARRHSRELWTQDRWPGATRPFAWLLEHFAPVPGWHGPDPTAQKARQAGQVAPGGDRVPSAGLAYYTDGTAPQAVLAAARATIARAGLPVACAHIGPPPPAGWAQAVVAVPGERGYLTMFRQILAALEALDTDVAFLVEHDVLYHPSHFAFRPPRADRFYYNRNVWKVDLATGRALHYECDQTSGLCADRQLLLRHYRERVARVEREGFSRRNGFEPGTRRVRHGGYDDVHAEPWHSEFPNVDVRHQANLTPSRWRREEFRNQKYTEGWTESDRVPGWGVTLGRMDALLAEVTRGV